MTKLEQAWEKFEKAVGFDDKHRDETKGDGLRRMSAKARDKHLDEAIRLEAEAIADGEKHP